MSQIERFTDAPQIAYVRGKSGQLYQVSPLVPGAMPLEQLQQSHIPQQNTASSGLAFGLAVLGGCLFMVVCILIAYGMGKAANQPIVVQPAPPVICSSGFLFWREERRC